MKASHRIAKKLLDRLKDIGVEVFVDQNGVVRRRGNLQVINEEMEAIIDKYLPFVEEYLRQ